MDRSINQSINHNRSVNLMTNITYGFIKFEGESIQGIKTSGEEGMGMIERLSFEYTTFRMNECLNGW